MTLLLSTTTLGSVFWLQDVTTTTPMKRKENQTWMTHDKGKLQTFLSTTWRRAASSRDRNKSTLVTKAGARPGDLFWEQFIVAPGTEPATVAPVSAVSWQVVWCHRTDPFPKWSSGPSGQRNNFYNFTFLNTIQRICPTTSRFLK